MLLGRSLLSVVLFLATATEAAPTPRRVQGEVLANRVAERDERGIGPPKPPHGARNMLVNRVAEPHGRDVDHKLGAPPVPRPRSVPLIDRAAAPEPAPEPEPEPEPEPGASEEGGPSVALIDRIPAHMIVHRIAERDERGIGPPHGDVDHKLGALPVPRPRSVPLIDRAAAPEPEPKSPPGDDSGPDSSIKSTPVHVLVDRVAEPLPDDTNKAIYHHHPPAGRSLTGRLMGRAAAPVPAPVPVPFPDDLSGSAAVLRAN